MWESGCFAGGACEMGKLTVNDGFPTRATCEQWA